MLKFLFDKEDELYYEMYKIFGIKFKRNKGIEPPTITDLRTYTMATQVNAKLEKYRGCFTGKDVIIVGAGPSIKYFDTIPKDVIKIGINRAHKLSKIKFDYLFAQDKFKKNEEIEDFINYNQDSCIKFLGIHTKQNFIRIRESTISKIKRKELYVLNNRRPQETLLPIDISMEPFAWFSGTVFATLQFCLFANARKIYLVGFDCSNEGHAFTDNKSEYKQAHQYKHWKLFKKYQENLFEETEIISINPINLKNMFKDVYTKSFVETHDLSDKGVDILEGEIL